MGNTVSSNLPRTRTVGEVVLVGIFWWMSGEYQRDLDDRRRQIDELQRRNMHLGQENTHLEKCISDKRIRTSDKRTRTSDKRSPRRKRIATSL